jgi:hypothetical protein
MKQLCKVNGVYPVRLPTILKCVSFSVKVAGETTPSPESVEGRGQGRRGWAVPDQGTEIVDLCEVRIVLLIDDSREMTGEAHFICSTQDIIKHHHIVFHVLKI